MCHWKSPLRLALDKKRQTVSTDYPIPSLALDKIRGTPVVAPTAALFCPERASVPLGILSSVSDLGNLEGAQGVADETLPHINATF